MYKRKRRRTQIIKAVYIAAARHKALASCNKWPLSRTEAYTDLFAQMTYTKEKIIYEAERTEVEGKGERGSVRKTGGDIKSQFGGVKPRVGEEIVVVGRRHEEGEEDSAETSTDRIERV